MIKEALVSLYLNLYPIFSIFIGLVLLAFVIRKRGLNKHGLEMHWMFLVIIGSAFILFPIAFFLDRTFFPNNIGVDQVGNTVTFDCSDNKILSGTFYKNGDVILEVHDRDGVASLGKLTKSGLRYYNSDKSFVFWSEGDTQMSTFVEENGIITLRCKFQSTGE